MKCLTCFSLKDYPKQILGYIEKKKSSGPWPSIVIYMIWSLGYITPCICFLLFFSLFNNTLINYKKKNNLIPKNIREKILGLGHILYTGFGQVLLQEILNLNFVLYQIVFWNLERLYILVISFEYVIVMLILRVVLQWGH